MRYRMLWVLLFCFSTAVSAEGRRYDLQFEKKAILYGEQRSGNMGNAVAAGDFDGDGIDDLAVATPGADRSDPDRKIAGRIDVYFGGPERRADEAHTGTGEADWVIFGGGEKDGIGYSLVAGDLDGDGRDELVVGSIFLDGPDGERVNCGGAYVFYGGPRHEGRRVIDLAREPADIAIFGAEAKDHLTGDMAAGDLDGDGRDDLVLGAFYADGPENGRHHCGEAHVLFGAPRSALPPVIDLAETTLPWIYGAEASDTFGRALAIGDLDGDGKGDIIGGAYYADGPDNERINAGEVYVLYGRPRDRFPSETDLTDGADLHIYGEAEGFVTGRDVAAADMNRDGRDDMLIGAHFGTVDPRDTEGSRDGVLYIVYGRPERGMVGVLDLGTNADCRIHGGESHEQLGWPLITGVIDEEGNEAVIAVAKKSSGGELARHEAGEAYFISSRPLRETLRGRISIDEAADFSVVGSNERDKAAFSGAVLDWNGDGRPEIALGVPDAGGPSGDAPSAGETILFFVP
ncbi:MAG: FG-GAP repeat protein [Candidatus Eisenbacteria bacterium]|nr:FG-GAP repeat protein [Candidatus Eisenbacteria bacterium]